MNPSPTTDAATEDGYEARGVAMLMRIADGYYAQESFRQAIEIYFDILGKFPDRPETRKVRERLMEIAELYESRGELRQARSLCERLL